MMRLIAVFMFGMAATTVLADPPASGSDSVIFLEEWRAQRMVADLIQAGIEGKMDEAGTSWIAERVLCPRYDSFRCLLWPSASVPPVLGGQVLSILRDDGGWYEQGPGLDRLIWDLKCQVRIGQPDDGSTTYSCTYSKIPPSVR